MNIGSYTLVKKQLIEELKEEIKQKEENLKEREKYIKELKERLECFARDALESEECIIDIENILIEQAVELEVYNLFIDCILNKDIRKAIAIYNRTKSIRIKHKNINSISKKIEKIKQIISL
ncbi:hypothetical protein [Clostridioides difficile]|uniref:hypothetical protein n=1 Tax=Clostridioides difficile TaxID=1496 RepID=UPI000C9F881D|nr:hypothetical protein [Clostridioides difficile]